MAKPQETEHGTVAEAIKRASDALQDVAEQMTRIRMGGLEVPPERWNALTQAWENAKQQHDLALQRQANGDY